MTEAEVSDVTCCNSVFTVSTTLKVGGTSPTPGFEIQDGRSAYQQ